MTNKENRLVVLIEWAGVTKELYEKARKEVWDGDVLPKGAILHIATFDEKGIIIIDIWENEEDFNNFVQKRLLPVTDKLIDTKPKIEILPLYALFLRNKE